MNDARYAPVQVPHTPHGMRVRIPWRIHVKAWQTYAKHYSGQSAERLAERGGFGLVELIYLLAGEDPFAVNDDPQMITDFFNEFPEEINVPKRK